MRMADEICVARGRRRRITHRRPQSAPRKRGNVPAPRTDPALRRRRHANIHVNPGDTDADAAVTLVMNLDVGPADPGYQLPRTGAGEVGDGKSGVAGKHV